MLIINYGNHDYYDKALAYILGPDKDYVYDRKQEQIEVKKLDYYINEDKIYANGSYYRFYQKIILFCGDLIPLIGITKDNISEEIKYIYSFDSLIKYCDNNKIVLEKGHEYIGFGHRLTLRKLQHFFKQKSEIGSVIFRKYNSPCLMIEPIMGENSTMLLTKNPNLGILGFAALYPPTEAFQKIYMFISNVLCSQKDIPENITDNIKRDQKGFDKYSFKTMKGDKKPRNKNRNKNIKDR